MSTNNEAEFAGITARDCCDGCGPKKCVITGNQFCGHPYKSSHPGAGEKVKLRIMAVKKILVRQKADAA